MLHDALLGTTAGAIGTVTLNITTYADMAIRGRASSSVPAKLAGALASKVGLDLSAQGAGSGDDTAQHRRTGFGALMGYVTGLSVGTIYGLVRPQLRHVPLSVAGVGVAVTAMATSDIPATVLGVTDPSTWSATDWALDFGFHLAYGLATVIAYDALTDR
jgi:hypothetical protein